MTDKKKAMITLILRYLYNDDQSHVAWENSEYCVEFWRPVGEILMTRHELSWNEAGDFEVRGVGMTYGFPAIFPMSRWFKVFSYLRSNTTSARVELKITRI